MRKGLLILIPAVALVCLIHVRNTSLKETGEAVITQQTINVASETETTGVQFEPEWAIIENTQVLNETIMETELTTANTEEMEADSTDPPVTQPVADGDDSITGSGDVGAGGEIDWG